MNRWQKMKYCYKYLMVGLLFAVPTVVVYADPIPHTFQAGQPSSAEELNANFDSLNDRSWDLSGSDLSYHKGNVGIGTETPKQKLDVDGKIKIEVDTTVYTSTDNMNPEVYNIESGGPTCTENERGSMFVGRTSGEPTQDSLCVCMNVDNVMLWSCFNP